MNSRVLLNLGLLVLAAIAGLVMVYLPGLEKPATPIALTSLKPAQVTHILMQRTGQADIRLVKQQQGWFMTAPLTLSANTASVDSLLELAQIESQQQFNARAQDLGKFNVAEPRVRVRLNDEEIAFGGTEPLQQRRYVLVNNTVHLINEVVYDSLLSAPTVWVSSALLPPASQLSSIELPGITLFKQSNGSWKLTPPQNNISSDTINSLVDEWTHAQAQQVKPYTTGTAHGKVLLHLQSSKNPISFDIQARTPELILARPDLGVQYHLPAELSDRLLKMPAPAVSSEAGDETLPHTH
ncbi:MAG: DUF4340 domain-containing protein [Gammaproteobacteria bacterium]